MYRTVVPEAVDLDVPATNRPQRIYLPYLAGAYSPMGGGVLDGLSQAAQKLSRTRTHQAVTRPPRPSRIKKMASAAGRTARKVFERSGEVFD